MYLIVSQRKQCQLLSNGLQTISPPSFTFSMIKNKNVSIQNEKGGRNMKFFEEDYI